jgi:hypothetical protein
MSFDDLQRDLLTERIQGLRDDADRYREVAEARRARGRRRRLRLWRRVVAPRLAATVQGVNDILGAILSPAWPASDSRTHPPVRPSAGR